MSGIITAYPQFFTATCLEWKMRLQPGKYKVTIKVNDGITKQQIAESAPFVVD